jgi:hypothetical protein
VRDCLDAIRADGDHPCGNPLAWCECLPHAVLDAPSPTLVAYFADWASADASDEACARAVLLDA